MLIATKTSKQASTIFAKSLFDYDLPSEWQLVVAGELLSSCEYGTSEPNSENGTIPIVGMKSIINGKINLNDVSYMEGNSDQYKNLHLCIGDILLNRTNSPDLVGKVGIVEYNSDVIFASYLVRLRTHLDKVDPYYLNFWLNHSIAQRALKRISTRAVSQANINPTEFRSYCPVPLPPLAEQQKIVKILRTWDDAIEKVEKLIVAHNKHLTFLMNFLLSNKNDLTNKYYKESLYSSKYGIQIMNKKWAMVNISDVCLTYAGGTPKRSNINYYNGNIPWIKSGEVENRKIIYSEENISKEGLDNSSAKLVSAGAVLIAMYGANAGQVGMLRIEAATNQAVLALLPKKNKINGDYLFI